MASRSYPAAAVAVLRALDSALDLEYPIGKYYEVQDMPIPKHAQTVANKHTALRGASDHFTIRSVIGRHLFLLR